jgi:nitroimidazol reductase NimA-like FMN-containing flavoprotein (pyridoxamine 5'-phosphate oxidase superfamily)
MANSLIEPIHDNAACEQVLQGTREGTLVMCEGDTPYAVPLNHAFVDGRFYFHCGLRGRKLDLIRRNPQVVYVVSKLHATPVEMPLDQRCHGPWESLLAYGTARVVENLDEKAIAFRAFMSWYGVEDYQMTDGARNVTSGIIIDVTSMTVRAELTRGETRYWLWLPPEVAEADADQ